VQRRWSQRPSRCPPDLALHALRSGPTVASTLSGSQGSIGWITFDTLFTLAMVVVIVVLGLAMALARPAPTGLHGGQTTTHLQPDPREYPSPPAIDLPLGEALHSVVRQRAALRRKG
jgi:hypothetical protein